MPITKLNSSRDFFRIWFLWKYHAVVAFVFIVGLVMFYAYGATPVYESKAKVLLLPRTNDDLVITAGDEERKFIVPVTEEDLNTEIELLMSANVIDEAVRAIDQEGLGLMKEDRGAFDDLAGAISGFFAKILAVFQLTEEPLSPSRRDARLLRKSLSIEAAVRSNVLLVTLKGENPAKTAEVLDTLLDIYVKRHNDVFSQDAGLNFYDDQAGTYLNRLEDAEKELQEFNLTYAIVDLANQNQANIALMTEMNKELQLIEIAFDEAESRIGILQQALEGNESEVLVTAEMRVIPAIVELEKAIIPLVIKKTEVAKGYTRESREYTDIEGQLLALKMELRKEVVKALETDKLELASWRIKKESLQRRINILEAKATEFNQLRLTAQELERQVQIHKNHYLVYTTKTEDSRIYAEKKDRNLANVGIVDRPSVPERPASPKKLLLLVASLILGSLSALCLPFILEAWDHKLKTVDDVEGLLGMQVISSFPEVRK
jgi:uncharacterized protein involved in exopolysaccharide biosynthesis